MRGKRGTKRRTSVGEAQTRSRKHMTLPMMYKKIVIIRASMEVVSVGDIGGENP